jgi:hypothetical protein
MENYKCAFSGALIGKQYGCQYALEVTRREGPSIACTSADMRHKCADLMHELKAAALPHFGHEDDLTQMPHSVLMKIQSGGLAGLQKHLQGATSVAAVENIEQLVIDAEQRYGELSAIPFTDFMQDIIDFKLRRRR